MHHCERNAFFIGYKVVVEKDTQNLSRLYLSQCNSNVRQLLLAPLQLRIPTRTIYE